MKWFILLISFLFLGGCTSMVPISPEMMKAAGVNVDNGISTIADASVLKELAVHKTLQNRDQMIAQATKSAGFKSVWRSCDRTVFYPGMKEPLLVTEPCLQVSYTPMPEFKQELPTAPSVHPGYKMTKEIVSSIANATLIGYGINTLGNVLETGLQQAGTDYSGSDYNKSFNSGEGNINVDTYSPPPEITE